MSKYDMVYAIHVPPLYHLPFLQYKTSITLLAKPDPLLLHLPARQASQQLTYPSIRPVRSYDYETPRMWPVQGSKRAEPQSLSFSAHICRLVGVWNA